VTGRFGGLGQISILEQRIQVLGDMYKRVIPICMGRSIERQDGVASDTFTDRQRN
jgi:hypothetical protein